MLSHRRRYKYKTESIPLNAHLPTYQKEYINQSKCGSVYAWIQV